MAYSTRDFEAELNRKLFAATNEGKRNAAVNAGELHRQLGEYPGPNHRIPICCEVMHREMKVGDQLISTPPKGKGASLTIRYQLPRH
jgi:5-methylcytosine-specific restriction protein A